MWMATLSRSSKKSVIATESCRAATSDFVTISVSANVSTKEHHRFGRCLYPIRCLSYSPIVGPRRRFIFRSLRHQGCRVEVRA